MPKVSQVCKRCGKRFEYDKRHGPRTYCSRACAYPPGDLTGQTFGRLLVESALPWPNWQCRCTCGAVVIIAKSHLLDGHTQSCGCLRREMSSARIIARHQARSPQTTETRRRSNTRRTARYRATHRDAVNAARRRRHARNPAQQRTTKRIYRQIPAVKESIRAANARRRARKRQVTINDLSAAQWREIIEAFDHRCVYCGRKMQRLTQDHITPVGPDGPHTLHNIVPACGSCNSRKHKKAPLKPVQPLLLTLAAPRNKKVS